MMELVFRDLSPTDPLLTFGQSGFRTRWNDLSALGAPLAKAPAGFDLAPGLRFRSDVSDGILRVFWRDRWRQASSAERYLHDAAASAVLHHWLKPLRTVFLTSAKQATSSSHPF